MKKKTETEKTKSQQADEKEILANPGKVEDSRINRKLVGLTPRKMNVPTEAVRIDAQEHAKEVKVRGEIDDLKSELESMKKRHQQELQEKEEQLKNLQSIYEHEVFTALDERIAELSERKDLPALRDAELFFEKRQQKVQEQYRQIASSELEREVKPKGKITIESIPTRTADGKQQLARLSWQEINSETGKEKKEAKMFSEYVLENRQLKLRENTEKRSR